MVGVRDLLGAPVEAIVNPANSGLSHGGGLAAVISREAGPGLDEECEKVVRKVGRIPVTMAVPTRAGDLPFRGIIHGVGPRMGDGDEQQKLERTFIHCLIVAERREWRSVAFPAISTGLFLVPTRVCAEAFRNALPAYWDQHPDSCVDTVWLCLTTDSYPTFREVLTASEAERESLGS
jgi:O-acetyl-ADP-ribose deacetylase (regulator of RNase III)